MKIVAACCWFLEPPEFLDRLIRSLAPLADDLVFLDGPWHPFPHDLACSTPEEYEAIEHAAAEANLPVLIADRTVAFESQMAKRSELFRVAIDECSADWVLVVDGDEEMTVCDVDSVRKSLELTDRDVIEAMTVPMNRVWPYDRMPSYPRPMRHMYRGIPGLRVEHAHNGIVTPDGRWLHGDQAYVRREPSLDLSRILQFGHDNEARPKERLEQRRVERAERQRQRLEAWGDMKARAK